MSGILCAVRGGPMSQQTMDKAIAMAAETDQPLYFLYVVNIEFLSHTATSRVHPVSEEVQQMGEFILSLAQSAAGREGVTAQCLIRHGHVPEVIKDLCHELAVDYLVLGRPQHHWVYSVFAHDTLIDFIKRTERQTGAKVVIAGGDGA